MITATTPSGERTHEVTVSPEGLVHTVSGVLLGERDDMEARGWDFTGETPEVPVTMTIVQRTLRGYRDACGPCDLINAEHAAGHRVTVNGSVVVGTNHNLGRPATVGGKGTLMVNVEPSPGAKSATLYVRTGKMCIVEVQR